jgi:hypothetical protein
MVVGMIMIPVPASSIREATPEESNALAYAVAIFSIFHIITRDVPYYDHRCVVSNAPNATQSSPSVSPPAPPRARHKMDQLMRWLISLLSFVEAKYYTLDTETILDTGEDGKGYYRHCKEHQKNSLRMEHPAKIIDTEEILDTGEAGKDAVPTLNRTLNPGKIIDTEKILDNGEDGKDAVPTLNPGSDKIIEDADLRLHPGKAIIDTAKNTKQNSLRMAKPGKTIDTEEIIDPGEETVRRDY